MKGESHITAQYLDVYGVIVPSRRLHPCGRLRAAAFIGAATVGAATHVVARTCHEAGSRRQTSTHWQPHAAAACRSGRECCQRSATGTAERWQGRRSLPQGYTSGPHAKDQARSHPALDMETCFRQAAREPPLPELASAVTIRTPSRPSCTPRQRPVIVHDWRRCCS